MLVLAAASSLLTPGMCLCSTSVQTYLLLRPISTAHPPRARPRCDAGPLPKKVLPRDWQGLPAGKVYAPRRLQRSAALHTLDAPPTSAGADSRRRSRRGAEQGGVTSGGGSSQPPRVRRQGKELPVRELQRLVVSGGDHRGRRLVTPGVYMRPMMSRVREALFSMVYPTGVLRESAATLDLFSGSGVVGIEALSRGIGRATFVDFSPVRERGARGP